MKTLKLTLKIAIKCLIIIRQKKFNIIFYIFVKCNKFNIIFVKIKTYIKMEKIIVWFQPEDNKIQNNQFHTEAKSNYEAIEECKKHFLFKHTILGVSKFRGSNNEFINKKIY